MTRAIGIDLGTTYTVVATLEGDRPLVVPNREGQHLTPSVVAFTEEGGILVGQPARSQAAADPDRAFFSIKRRMGSDYLAGIPGKQYTPQEISSFILGKAKADAEAYLGERIDQAVITVPAYFNDRQRHATREAGILAGLRVLRIISEPTAAALAYGLHRDESHTVLVWDLGGGTFDVSILELGDGVFEVRAVSGDAWLGGDDFTTRLMSDLARTYKLAHRSEVPADSVFKHRLREAAEKAKTELSFSLTTCVHVPLAPQPGSLEAMATREQLEGLTVDLLHRMQVCTQQALRDAGLLPKDVDRVILVGGATRMPAVRELARKVMGREPFRHIDPDEVVAHGAAIQAGMLLGQIKRAVLLDVLPLSLGVETQGGLTARIIPRNTPLPAAGSRVFTTAADYQTAMDIHVLQGERELASDNISLGQLHLDGIPRTLRGGPKVEVCFRADNDGIVQVSATELLSDNEVGAKMVTGLLGRSEIDRLAEEACRKAEEDRLQREGVRVRIEAENVIAAAEMALRELGDRLEDIQREQLRAGIRQVQEALARGQIENAREQTRRLRLSLPELSARLAPSCRGGTP